MFSLRRRFDDPPAFPINILPTKRTHFARAAQTAIAGQGDNDSPVVVRTGFHQHCGFFARNESFAVWRGRLNGDICKGAFRQSGAAALRRGTLPSCRSRQSASSGKPGKNPAGKRQVSASGRDNRRATCARASLAIRAYTRDQTPEHVGRQGGGIGPYVAHVLATDNLPQFDRHSRVPAAFR